MNEAMCMNHPEWSAELAGVDGPPLCGPCARSAGPPDVVLPGAALGLPTTSAGLPADVEAGLADLDGAVSTSTASAA